MAVTGTTTFQSTLSQIIYDAYALIAVYGMGRKVTNEDYTLAIRFLNRIIKYWGTYGLLLWCKEEATLFTQQYVGQYYMGSNSPITAAPCALTNNTILTQTTAQYAVGTTTINVISTAGMQANYYIGLVQSDNSTFWTTISSVTNSTTLVLAAGNTVIINNAALVYVYSALLNKPYKIEGARRIVGFDSGISSTQSEIVLAPMSRIDYENIPLHTVNGIPTQYYYDPQQSYGCFNLWPRPVDTNYRIQFTYDRLIDDITNPTDNLDFPIEWERPLIWSLAVELGPAFGKDKKIMSGMAQRAEELLQNLIGYNQENVNLQVQPDDDGGGVY